MSTKKTSRSAQQPRKTRSVTSRRAPEPIPSGRARLRTRQLSAHACAVVSLVAAAGALAAATLLGTGWRWSLELLLCAAALLFAYQGFRLSKEPGTPYATFAHYGSIVGAGLAIAAAAGFVMLLVS